MLKRFLYSLASLAALTYILGAPHKYLLQTHDGPRTLRRNGHRY